MSEVDLLVVRISNKNKMDQRFGNTWEMRMSQKNESWNDYSIGLTGSFNQFKY